MNHKDLRRILFERRFELPKEKPVRRVIGLFTSAEKTVFTIFTSLFVLSGAILLWQVSSAYMVEVPTRGGTLVEGVVGNPRFINPVLALSEADKNLTSLIYSGLLRVTPEGEVVTDLAESYSVSENGLIYTVTLKPQARFHDGTRVTADDVIFTVQKILDPLIKSPRRGNWDGVVVEKLDERTLTFTLRRAYSPFIYNLTVGILPRHVWRNVSEDEFAFSQWNTLPIGAGPYQVERVERNSGGIPNFYKLSPFAQAESAPYIKNLIFRFYPNEEALLKAFEEGRVQSLGGLSPERVAELNLHSSTLLESPLPRVFALFFNQSQSKVLAGKEVRQALALSAPRREIVERALQGFATPIAGPLPAGIYPWTTWQEEKPLAERLTEARALLEAGGWSLNAETNLLEKKSGSDTLTLSFSISTSDAPELVAVAEELKSTWEKLGAVVEVKVFETGDLNQSVIRPRSFETLLFGVVVGREADLYPFWHSSQRNDPGLNIALYANNQADRLLEEVRTSEGETLETRLQAFERELEKDTPAVFLYTPSFIYLAPQELKSLSLGPVSTSQDRFLGIREWYIETDKVWKIFLKDR